MTNLSVEERLAAGEQYIKNGGNGVTLAYYEKLLDEYKGALKRSGKNHKGGY